MRLALPGPCGPSRGPSAPTPITNTGASPTERSDGDDGLDELTTTGTSTVWVVRDGTATETTFDPADIGIPRSQPGDLRGADAVFNARVAREVIAGTPGPVRDIVALNAAAALVAVATTTPATLTEALSDGYLRACEAIDSGRATTLLDRWVALSSQLQTP